MTPEAEKLLEEMIEGGRAYIGASDPADEFFLRAALSVFIAHTRGARAKDAYEILLEIVERDHD